MPGDEPSQDKPEDLSQADIDAALAGAGGGGDESAGAAAEGSDAAPATDATGDLSQADIDAALAGAGGETTASSSEDKPIDPSVGFSQADIDVAMGVESSAASTDGEGPAEAAVAEAAVSETDSGAGTQAEIDAALAAAEGQLSDEAESPKLDSAGRPFDEAAAAMEAAIEEERVAAEAAQKAAAPAASPAPAVSAAPVSPAAPPPPPAGSVPLDLPDLGAAVGAVAEEQGLDLLSDVELNVKIELGRAEMLIENVLALGDGAVVKLDKLAGDPVDVFVNDRLVARGEVLVLNDNFCVRISEIISTVEELEVA